MSQLRAGYARVNVTPMMGIRMRGYYRERLADGVLDELELSALAIENDGKQALLISIDNIAMMRECALAFKAHISETTGVPEDAIYIHATHTHTGPFLNITTEHELEKEYFRFVYHRMADVSKFALDDLKPAKAGWGVGIAPEIAFIRSVLRCGSSTPSRPNAARIFRAESEFLP